TMFPLNSAECTYAVHFTNMSSLSSGDREFFTALDRVVYGNPFSERREKLIPRLAPESSKGNLDADRDMLARLVEPRLRPYVDLSDLQRMAADDRRLVQSGFLYV